MSDTKLDPRSLTSEERALWDQLAMRALGNGCYAYECFAITEGVFRELLEKRRAIFGGPASEVPVEEIRRYWRGPIGSADAKKLSDWLDSQPEPASEPAKVQCPNCGEMTVDGHCVGYSATDPGRNDKPMYYCKPAQPKPVAEEAMTAKTLEQEAREAAEAFSRVVWRGGSREFRNGRIDTREDFRAGYLAAATARDKEIEELRERATQLESDFDGVRENLSAEVAGLKVTVLKLEAQVDDYEEKMSRVPAGFFA